MVPASAPPRQGKKSPSLRRADAASTGSRTSRPVVGVDADVVGAEVARPDRRRSAAAGEVDAHGDLALLHHPLAVLLAVARPPAAALDDVDVVEEEVDARLLEIDDAGVADGGEDAAKVRVAREERRLDQRRVADRVRGLAAFGDVAAAF